MGTTKKSLRELLTEYCESRKYSITEEVLQEVVENMVSIWTDPHLDEHRWYSRQKYVIGFDNRFFACWRYVITGDNSASDMGLEPPSIDEITEVYPHVVETVVYKPEPSTEEETVKITKKEYDSLLDSSSKLDALEATGVDNWCGWDDAMKEYREYNQDD